MLFYRLSKTATKDVDLVLETEKEREHLVSVLSSLGFKEAARPAKKGEPVVWVLGEYRLDIFAGQVFNLKLSSAMMQRVREKVTFGNFTAAVAAPEDIILSKSMTDRLGDRQDAAAIIREINVKWEDVVAECRWQSQHADPRFCVFLYDFLDELVHQFSISLPATVVKEIKKMYRQFMESLEPPEGK